MQRSQRHSGACHAVAPLSQRRIELLLTRLQRGGEKDLKNFRKKWNGSAVSRVTPSASAKG